MDIIEFNGKANMLLTSIRDITYLKRTEEELTKERDFFKRGSEHRRDAHGGDRS
jgi:hypothetical protein